MSAGWIEALLAVGAAWTGVLGYVIGLRRFGGKLKAHDEALRAGAALRRTTHTALLDGASNSGKTTLRLRLSFPCTDRAKLAQIAATSEAKIYRPQPLYFEAPDRLYELQFADVGGERPQGIDAVLRQVETRVVAVWLWDLSRTDAENQEALNVARLKATYGSEVGRKVKQVLVFLNKTDTLTLDEHKLAQIAQTEDVIRAMARSVFDQDFPVSFHRGSALDGTGVLDLYGAMLRAFGLGNYFEAAP